MPSTGQLWPDFVQRGKNGLIISHVLKQQLSMTVRSQPWIIPTIYTLAAQLRAEASGSSVYECILLPSSAGWEPVAQMNSNNFHDLHASCHVPRPAVLRCICMFFFQRARVGNRRYQAVTIVNIRRRHSRFQCASSFPDWDFIFAGALICSLIRCHFVQPPGRAVCLP